MTFKYTITPDEMEYLIRMIITLIEERRENRRHIDD